MLEKGFVLFSTVFLTVVLPLTFAQSSLDSLIVDPLHPTPSDSIHLSVITPSPCCCNDGNISFSYHSTMHSTMGDTSLVIYHRPRLTGGCIDTFCGECAKDKLNYSIPPIKAGVYTVYKSILRKTIECPEVPQLTSNGTINFDDCTETEYPGDSMEIGRITVSTGSSSSIRPSFSKKNSMDLNFECYDLRGKRISPIIFNTTEPALKLVIIKANYSYSKRIISR